MSPALAVALAGAYLANYADVPAQVVLAKLRESGVGDIEPTDDDSRHDPLGLAYRRSVAASLSLHFEREDVKPALPMLVAAAYLHPTGITVEWLAAGTGWTEDEVRKAAKTLARHSIIRYEGTISVHRLTLGVARARLAKADREGTARVIKDWLDALLTCYRYPAAIAEQLLDHTKTPARLAALPHAEAVIAHFVRLAAVAGDGGKAPLPHTPTPPTEADARALGNHAALLRGELAKWLPNVGMHAPAQRHLDAAIDWGESQNPRDERSLAIWYASRARIRQERGDHAGAEADLKRSIDWGESQNPRDERSLAIRYAARARLRRAQAVAAREAGDAATAAALFTQAKADIANALAWFEKNMPTEVRGIAIFRQEQARIEKAERGGP